MLFRSPESSIHENIWLDKLDYYYSIKNLRLFSRNYNDVAYVIGASTLGMVPDGEEDDFAARKFYDADEYYYSYNTAFLIKDSAAFAPDSVTTAICSRYASRTRERPACKLAVVFLCGTFNKHRIGLAEHISASLTSNALLNLKKLGKPF